MSPATAEKQRTIDGCGLAATVATSKLPSDPVQCVDCDEMFPRSEIHKETDCCEECTEDNFTPCELCEKMTPGDDINIETGCCEDCTRDNFKSCEICSELTLDDDINADTDCCESCTNEHYYTCEECDTLTHGDDIRSGEGSQCDTMYCETCFDENHIYCDSCNDTVTNDDSRCSDTGESFCEDCYMDAFFYCEGCESETAIEDAINTEDGLFCEDCAPSGDGADFEPRRNWTGTDKHDKIGSPRKFGIELESHVSGDYYEWVAATGWGAKEDGSTRGKEFVSPPLWGNDGYDSVIDFCEQAQAGGVEPNHKCGYHLHLDLSDTTDSQRRCIALAYHYTRDLWADFIEPGRRDTSYAAYSTGSKHYPNRGWNEESILAGTGHPTGSARYLWLNWGAHSRFGTVEVRSHEPTFSSERVINWVKAHTLFIDHVRPLTVGKVTRVLGNENVDDQIAFFREIWPEDLSGHYLGKRDRLAQEA